MPPKKNKFVSIKSFGENAVLPGRQKCSCLGMKHDLVNNCLSCGKIVCIQEGPGPCFFCGDIVLTKEERSKSGKERVNLLLKYSDKNKVETNKNKADETKERLLEYDRTSAARTKVYDDQCDYFSTSNNSWLSGEERELNKKKIEAYEEAKKKLKRQTRITIDIAGRRLVEELPPSLPFEDLSFLSSKKLNKSEAKNDDKIQDTGEGDLKFSPIFIPNSEFESELKSKLSLKNTKFIDRNIVQDGELMEMSDFGNCISIQQPYASLIIDGIKRFEGRSWYTPIRGRLWISSGAKSPSPDLIKSIQNSYKHIVGDVEFPCNYPTGALLGYVDLVDCIPQEEYLKMYEGGEITEPFVFILANPTSLPSPLPIPSKSKIFKLEFQILQAARKMVQKN